MYPVTSCSCGLQLLQPRSCEFFFVVVCFCFLFFLFFSLTTPRISDRLWTQRGFMLCPSVYFQSGDVNAALRLYVARQTVAGPWLVSCCCCSSLCRRCGEGGGSIKTRSPTPRTSLWRRKVKREGWSTWHQGTPPNPLYLPTTGVYFPALYRPGTRTLSEENFPLPRQINAKRPNTSANRSGPQLWSGEKDEESDKHVEKNKKRARTVAVAFLNAYPLCPGNDEARDHRRRRISVEISEGKRTRKRSTGPNIQPKLTGHFGR